MNKTDLISAVAAAADLTKKDADAAVAAVIETITDALAKDIEIPASKAPAFKAGKALKDSVNK